MLTSPPPPPFTGGGGGKIVLGAAVRASTAARRPHCRRWRATSLASPPSGARAGSAGGAAGQPSPPEIWGLGAYACRFVLVPLLSTVVGRGALGGCLAWPRLRTLHDDASGWLS